MAQPTTDDRAAATSAAANARVLRTITLETPIRYAAGDPVEAWLNGLLCLDASVVARAGSGVLLTVVVGVVVFRVGCSHFIHRGSVLF